MRAELRGALIRFLKESSVSQTASSSDAVLLVGDAKSASSSSAAPPVGHALPASVSSAVPFVGEAIIS